VFLYTEKGTFDIMRKRLKKKESENISKNKNYVLGTESKESVEIYGETLL